MGLQTLPGAGVTASPLTARGMAPQAVLMEVRGELTLKARTLFKTPGGSPRQDLAMHDPQAAVSVRHGKAPIAAAGIVVANAVKMRRATTRSRNPESVPDAWEAKILSDIEQGLTTGAKPDTMEHCKVVKERALHALRCKKDPVVQPLFPDCQKTLANIPGGVKAKLAELYPTDLATGCSVTMLRGAVSLKKPSYPTSRPGSSGPCHLSSEK